jgi:hypothetical protein
VVHPLGDELLMARLVRISGLQRLELRVPFRSLRGLLVNQDAAWIDRRCLKRYKRRRRALPPEGEFLRGCVFYRFPTIMRTI